MTDRTSRPMPPLPTPIDAPSPNWDERPSGQAIDMLVLHYTGMQSGPEACARLRDPEAKVSAHWLVEEDGQLFAMVPEDKRAWHAGVASWLGHTNINARSIGIEIVNPGHEFGYRPFPAVQMQSVTALCQAILARHPAIRPWGIVGHSDVAPRRKQDPGELFDWPGLAAAGIGLWPQQDPILGSAETDSFEPKMALKQLAAIGYEIVDAEATATAFARRFAQNRVGWSLEDRSLQNRIAQVFQLYAAAKSQ